ncbi:GGDEF domain-containing protein [Photobacterium sp. GSS17]|uniref:GGDEF domain-containing protein n=1 Tax=Photobacterium sp. GSS17 TaxID=3020715 RepID=UPI0023611616|nr:GGDEF domain-containing protein [Photobacterium sp. GSS17]
MSSFQRLFSFSLKTILLFIFLNCSYSVSATVDANSTCLKDLSKKLDASEQQYLNFYLLSQIDPSAAIKLLPQSNDAVKAMPASLMAKALLLLGKLRIEQSGNGNRELANQYLEALDKLAAQSRSRWLKLEVEYREATILVDENEFALAQVKLKSVRDAALKQGHRHLYARSLKWLGNIDVDLGAYESALTNYERAYQTFEQCGDQQQLILILSNIASLYINMEEWHQADSYISRAFDRYDKEGSVHPIIESVLHINAAEIEQGLDNIQRRKMHVDRAIELSDKISSLRVQLNALVNLSSYYLDTGNEEAALKAANQCFELASGYSGGNELNIALCHESLADNYLSSGWQELALEHGLTALSIYEAENDVLRKSRTYLTLAKIYESKGQFETALAFYKRFSEDNKKFLFDIRQKELYALQERFDANVNEKEIQLLKKEKELVELRLAEKKASEDILRLGTGLIIIVLYVMYRRYRMVTKRKRLLEKFNAELLTQTNQDALTGLHNRRFLEQWLNRQSKTSFQHGYLVSVIDIDHFKKINDELGHQVGDEVLVEIANRLRKAVRKNDIVVRWGGEEFVLVMACQPEECDACLTRILDCVRSKDFELSCTDLPVTISMGAVYTNEPTQLSLYWSEMLVRADKALYEVKRSGRNGYQFSELEHEKRTP